MVRRPWLGSSRGVSGWAGSHRQAHAKVELSVYYLRQQTGGSLMEICRFGSSQKLFVTELESSLAAANLGPMHVLPAKTPSRLGEAGRAPGRRAYQAVELVEELTDSARGRDGRMRYLSLANAGAECRLPRAARSAWRTTAMGRGRPGRRASPPSAMLCTAVGRPSRMRRATWPRARRTQSGQRSGCAGMSASEQALSR